MKHYIIVKWNEKVSDKIAMIPKVEVAYAPARDIEGVECVKVIPGNSDRENRYDIMIEMTLSKQGLENYDESVMHKAWKENFGEFFEKKCIFDCD